MRDAPAVSKPAQSNCDNSLVWRWVRRRMLPMKVREELRRRTLSLSLFSAALLVAELFAVAGNSADQVDQAFQGGAANFEIFVRDHPEYLAYRQGFTYLYQRYPN